MQPPLEETAKPAQRSGGDDAFGRSADAEQPVGFAGRGTQRASDVAVADELQLRPGCADFSD